LLCLLHKLLCKCTKFLVCKPVRTFRRDFVTLEIMRRLT
jgi:hypothetical protein